MTAQNVCRGHGEHVSRGRGEVVPEQAVGSAAAFTAIFRDHHDACLRLARRVVQDEGLAHDVVQDVFLTWWRTDGGNYDAERGELAAWLATLTHHEAVDALRAAERQRRLLRRSGSDVAGLDAPPDEVVWWETARAVRAGPDGARGTEAASAGASRRAISHSRDTIREARELLDRSSRSPDRWARREDRREAVRCSPVSKRSSIRRSSDHRHVPAPRMGAAAEVERQSMRLSARRRLRRTGGRRPASDNFYGIS